MGYTHYWYRPLEISKEVFERIVEDFNKTLEPLKALGVRLADGVGEGYPSINNEEVIFNGEHNCGHKENDSIVIPWPSNDAQGIGNGDSNKAKDGNWFAGVTLNSRCCDGHCDYETFHFPRKTTPNEWQKPEGNGLWFSCTKTAYRPYDLAVIMFLIIAKKHLKDNIKVVSDGTLKQWKDGIDICQNVLGYGQDFNFDETEDC